MGENTGGDKIGLHLAQCNGTCECAPQIWVDGKVVGPLDALKTSALVRDLKSKA
jgi:NADH:ubiquinone oxidoreductase subunit E